MMDNYDSNMIKPVDRLQNVTGMTPTRRREQRKQRQNYDSENNEQQNKQHNEENITQQIDASININNDGDDTKIDYCA